MATGWNGRQAAVSANALGIVDDAGDWNDWKFQLKHAITTLEQVRAAIELTPQERKGIEELTQPEGRNAEDIVRMPLMITPYYLSLCDGKDPRCPLRLQCIPRDLEGVVDPGDLLDPLGEKAHEVAPGLVRRYPDRALLLVTLQCAMSCRFCTRASRVAEQQGYRDLPSLEPAFMWLKEHPDVRELLVSGGDPLVASDGRIEELLKRIRQIESIEVIRIGTRVPTVLPMRITDSLVAMLRKYHPLWVMSHFNHPKELTRQAKQALEKLVDAGIPVMNQTVMLRGINDDDIVLTELFRGLVASRVRPYYLLHGDVMQGTWHFRTTIQRSIEVYGKLQGRLSGIALPKLMVDVPGGGGKVPIGPNTIVHQEPGATVLLTYRGEKVTVRDPVYRDDAMQESC